MCNLVQIDDWAGVFSFSFTLTPAYDENVAFSLCEIIFAIIEIYLAPEMWEGRKARDHQAIDPPLLDAYVNLIQYIQILTSSIQFNYSKVFGCCLNISSFVRLK